jgi:RND family efflux transporter MFP subunit
MKKILFTLGLITLVVSCKQQPEETNLSELTKEKSTLMKQIDSLNNRLKEVDEQIALLDTTKQLQKVTLLTAKDTLFSHFISLQGTVASDQNVVLHPEMGGNITAVLVKEGQRVSAGQRLVQFDNQSVLDQINEVQIQLDLASTTYERQKRLWDQKIGSEMQFLQAKSQKEGLEKTLRSLQTQLGKMTLRAPFSGVIDEIFAKKGEMTAMQSPILRLVNLSKMYVEAEVPEAYLTSIKKGTPVVVAFDALGKEVSSKVSEVGSFINPENRSFKIKIDLNNRDGSLKPNLLANLKINDFKAQGVVLPKQIIQMNTKGETFVFTIKQDSTRVLVEKVPLVLSKEYNNEVLVQEGLKGGEKLIYEGGKFVKEGDEVHIQE